MLRPTLRYLLPVSDEQLPETRVPRLPRGGGWKLSQAALFRILTTAALLVAVIYLRRPCADSVGTFLKNFDAVIDAGVAAPTPAPVPPGIYVPLHSGMSEDEVKATIDKARAAALVIDAGVPLPDAGPTQK